MAALNLGAEPVSLASSSIGFGREILLSTFLDRESEQVQGSLDVIRSIVARDAALYANAQTTQVELQAEFTAAMRRASAVDKYQKTALL